jgi:staphyloferrin B biosynthesis citrate synthase
MSSESRRATFRQRLRTRTKLVGTWVKTPSPIICEVLCRSELDLLALDAEHAPFGRAELDACLAICRALDMPTLVRVAAAEPALILNALDCGASGVLVPHVDTAQKARDAVRACHFGPGGRGYAGSTRAAGFGARNIVTHRQQSSAETTVILQIEDATALDEITAIAAVDNIDALFVGRIDLTVSLDKSQPDDAAVVAAVAQICAAGKQAAVAVGMFVSNPAEAHQWTTHGASLFILGSDHGFLLDGAQQLLQKLRS